MATSSMEQKAAKISVGASGQVGTVGAFLLVANKIVTSTNMKAAAYTIAAQPTVPAILSVLATAVGTADTMGTIDFVGTDRNGAAQTETVIPIAGTTVLTTKVFKTVTTATGVGWVIDGGSQNDTIIIGVAAIVAPSGYYFSYLQVMAAMVVAAQIAQTGFLVSDLSKYTSIPVGIYPTRLTSITVTSGEGILGLNQI